ncbi:oligosaccharide flippase family protein [Parafrankia sp. EUN1f]|uniref:oligosaccharide flippase family protein n=1 Tax=Parafrankia sp. EUN1f TaxID=102897 RepID=UPI0001C468A8|nr:oligosaccharide flippase family protein [Parafrankia sp. EUN1f]EFC80586.1 polysaccharide biosynthesis protein [Parafrankia sp. EUN1f]
MPDPSDENSTSGPPSPRGPRPSAEDQERTVTLAWDPAQLDTAAGREPAEEDIERTVLVTRPGLPPNREPPEEDIERTVLVTRPALPPNREPPEEDIERTVLVIRQPATSGPTTGPDALLPVVPGKPAPPRHRREALVRQDAEPTLMINNFASHQRSSTGALALRPADLGPVVNRRRAAETPDDELSSKVRKGLGWSFLNNVISRAGVLIIGIALARMLVPEQFGIFTIALASMQLLMSLNDAGMTTALIRWEGDIREVERTGVTLIMVFSAGLYAVFFVTAPLIAELANIPDASWVLRALALTILIDATAAVPTALLTRSYSQGRRAIADTANLLAWAGLSIGLVAGGMGVWALVIGRLSGNLLGAAMIFVLAPRRPRPGFRRDMARRLAADGVPLSGSAILTVCMLNVDTMIAARVLGPVLVSFYAQAFNLSSWPVNMFSFAVRRVSLVGFSQLVAEPSRLRYVYARSLALLVAATVPVCVLLVVLGKAAIEAVYGEEWVPAAEALRLLALLSIIRVAVEITDDLLVAVGKARTMVRLQVIWLVALVPALSVGAHLDGVRGVAIGHLGVALVIVLPVFTLALRGLGFRLLKVARLLVRPALGGIAFAVVAQLGAQVTTVPVLQVLIGGSAGTLVYLAIVAPMRGMIRQASGGSAAGDSHKSW